MDFFFADCNVVGLLVIACQEMILLINFYTVHARFSGHALHLQVLTTVCDHASLRPVVHLHTQLVRYILPYSLE